MTKEFSDNGRNFVYGPGNPEGLRIEFRMDGDRSEAGADVIFPERFQGREAAARASGTLFKVPE